MAGFKNVSEYAQADLDGQVHYVQFTKTVPSVTTATSTYVDFSYFGGSPAANFYASTPLEAAELPSTRGIYLPSVTPAKQFLHNITMMSVDSAQNSALAQRQQITLCDYLMYYPFIDTDSTDQQDMVQTITIPRYASGRVMCVSQSSSSTVGAFTFGYTNQDGVSGRVSPTIYTRTVTSGGLVINATNVGATTGIEPFCPLQAGDREVKSIDSVTFSTPGGGLMAFVIVKPLLTFFCYEGCRTQTSAVAGSYGSPVERNSIIHGPPIELKDGAKLSWISQAHGGSLASTRFNGYMETFYN